MRGRRKRAPREKKFEKGGRRPSTRTLVTRKPRFRRGPMPTAVKPRARAHRGPSVLRWGIPKQSGAKRSLRWGLEWAHANLVEEFLHEQRARAAAEHAPSPTVAARNDRAITAHGGATAAAAGLIDHRSPAEEGPLSRSKSRTPPG
ncbi:hypothetical protein HPB50_027062 [Hyalomma asiaticum]|uniref:Uncharacterized protein n=1 Tax=Hyalomma asiaticum TaxID=266040 RepID=A0ACB7RQP2_HYAAI|nr:hypothetical protein HPB50_027062 [Hyalomma asiaticum]